MDYKQLAKQYELQIEANALFNEDKLKGSRALMVLAGVICQMQSDLLLYRANGGKKEKIEMQQDRVNVLYSIYKDLTLMDNENHRMKLILAANNIKRQQAEFELLEAQKELEGVQKAWQQI